MSKYLIIILLLLAGCKAEIVTLDNGLVCARAADPYSAALDCNWDKYNYDTNYGEYPYAKNQIRTSGKIQQK